MSCNRNICHSCRKSGHWLQECPAKRVCPRCGNGFLQWLEVYRTVNSGKKFFSCNAGCGYFDWEEKATKIPVIDVGESSTRFRNREVAIDAGNDLASLFKILANITEEKDVKCTMKFTVSKGKGSGVEKDEGNEKDDGKGKEKM